MRSKQEIKIFCKIDHEIEMFFFAKLIMTHEIEMFFYAKLIMRSKCFFCKIDQEIERP
jgi:hypothetical protein